MLDRTFGAVIRDVPDEVRNLVTIKVRNERFARNPLSDYFLADLLAPIDTCEVFAFRRDWRNAAAELADLINRAHSEHWERPSKDRTARSITGEAEPSNRNGIIRHGRTGLPLISCIARAVPSNMAARQAATPKTC
ncbi:hypothetical protein M0D69_22475 [Caballeronia sp. SEWSISQ10-4 2]|uniref:hypothetical protein n=1 Tax=Caballeronia sp. SEWSISQ10-4 2 TaxID=2937438 RepID=UPI00264B5D79|nr:hypothetical protein [Caballeronia sp. SEWSISQ10-4 2]MDN7180713.1 hypothetical protein [Caballeronia sp. SEWSISQ10-4 2]